MNNKIVTVTLTSFGVLLGLFVLFACTSSGQELAGGAGVAGNSNGSSSGNSNGENSTTQEMNAEYQITSPKTMPIDGKGIIKLIIVPNTLPIEKMVFQSFEKNITQAFQGDINIYPLLTAEIVPGNSFSLSPTSIELPVKLDEVTTWNWHITALEIGVNRLAVNISAPSNVDGIIEHVEFEINVLAPTFTPVPPTYTPVVPTLTPVPSSTPIPSVGAQLAASAGNLIIGVVLTILGGVITIWGGYFIQKKMKDNADAKQEEKMGNERKIKDKQFKDKLPQKPKKSKS